MLSTTSNKHRGLQEGCEDGGHVHNLLSRFIRYGKARHLVGLDGVEELRVRHLCGLGERGAVGALGLAAEQDALDRCLGDFDSLDRSVSDMDT
jgi:hypothetical protein